MSISLLGKSDRNQAKLDAVEDFAFRYGRCFDSYLVTEPDRKHFWSRDRQGVVGFVQLRKYIKIAGGLVGPESGKEKLLSELVEHAEKRKLFLSFYNITEDELPLFEKYGFQATKWGEEPIVDLADQTWTGKAFEWVRRQTNYCRRQGLVLQEYREDLLSAEESDRIMAEMKELTAELTKTRVQNEDLKFMQGEVHPNDLRRKRIFLARAEEGRGRIEGYLVCNPGMNGDFWAFEIYRHRPDAVRGTISFLMHQTMQVLQAEGVRHVSLCLVPGMGCSQSRPGDSALARWGFVLAAKYLGFLFDTAGMYHFKSRFRPRFESRYICVRPKITVGSSIAFLQILGVFNVNLRNLCGSIWEHLRKSALRTSLASLDAASVQTATAETAPADSKEKQSKQQRAA